MIEQTQKTWLDESVSNYLHKIEDIGWTKLSQLQKMTDEDGPTLESLQGASKSLRDAAATQPLPQRGNQLRHAYVFGRGMTFNGLGGKPRVTTVINDPHNKAVLFSVEAYEQANSAKFTDGLFCVVYEKKEKKFTQLPLHRISGFQTNPNDPMDIWAVKTTWYNDPGVWIMLSRNKNREKQLDIDENLDEKVAKNTVAYISHTKRQSGWTLGVPDSLAGHVMMLAYNAYLKENLELVHALSQIAWKITTPNAAATQKAAVEMSRPGDRGGIGGTIATSGEVNSLGVPSSQVDFNKGQPVAALVATSYSVPVIALLSSPGATGGSYGAATTLDAPTLKGFEAVQDSWKLFYEEILHDLGAKDAEVVFPTISNDPEYRQINSMLAAVEGGLIWREEARPEAADILNVPLVKKGLPPLQDHPDKSGTIVTDKNGSVVPKQGSPAKGAAQLKDAPTNHDNDD